LGAIDPDVPESCDVFEVTDYGDNTKSLLGITRCDFTARVTVQTSGTYTISYGVANDVINYKGKTASVTFDGTTTSFSLATKNPAAATTTRHITAPYQDFACSCAVDFGIADFFDTTVESTDGGARYPVFAFDRDMVWQPAGNTLPNNLQVGGPGPTTYAGFPFSVGFGYEADVRIDGEWDGWSYDSGGNRFRVDTSRYAVSYTRTIYRVGEVAVNPGVGAS
jgi:hypothetical protein